MNLTLLLTDTFTANMWEQYVDINLYRADLMHYHRQGANDADVLTGKRMCQAGEAAENSPRTGISSTRDSFQPPDSRRELQGPGRDGSVKHEEVIDLMRWVPNGWNDKAEDCSCEGVNSFIPLKLLILPPEH